MEKINSYFNRLSAVVWNEINDGAQIEIKYLQGSYHEFKNELQTYLINNTMDKNFLRTEVSEFLPLIQEYEDWYNIQFEEREKYIEMATKRFKDAGGTNEEIKAFFDNPNNLPDCCIVTTLKGRNNFLTEHGILNEAIRATKNIILGYFPDLKQSQQITQSNNHNDKTDGHSQQPNKLDNNLPDEIDKKIMPFSELLTCDDEIKPALIEYLKRTFGRKGGKGKLFAIMICALEKAGMISYTDRDGIKLYNSIKENFGDIGGVRGFQSYIGREGLSKEANKVCYTNKLQHSEIDEYAENITKEVDEIISKLKDTK